MKIKFEILKNLLFESILTERVKHWPEDYKKTAINTIKNSSLMDKEWYDKDFVELDVDQLILLFEKGRMTRKNSNLGYFSTIVKWFVEQSSLSKENYDAFRNQKIAGIIRDLRWLSNNPKEEQKIKEDLKNNWAFSDFEKYQKEVVEKGRRVDIDSKRINGAEYELIPIHSYKELHENFGGMATGYEGFSEWCHANKSSDYKEYLDNGENMFFILARKDWKNIQPPNPENDAYDEYGLSLIALVVNVTTLNLVSATLRWNHVIEPSKTIPGASVDNAFNSLDELNKIAGFNVREKIENELKTKRDAIFNKAEKVNKFIDNLMTKTTTISQDFFLKNNAQPKWKNVTEVKIPENVKTIGEASFYLWSKLNSVEIPNSVTSIGKLAFYKCKNLKEIIIPDSVLKIGDFAFYECSGIENLKIGNHITRIGEEEFMRCYSIKNLVIPDSVQFISGSAFYACTSLSNIVLSKNLKVIGPEAFGWCKNLKSIVIPKSVVEIGDNAFVDCPNLDNVVFEGKTIDEVKQMDEYPWGIKNENIIKTDTLKESRIVISFDDLKWNILNG